MKVRTWITVAAMALLLAGCAGQPALGPNANPRLAAIRWNIQRHQLETIHTFTLEARIAASGSFGVSGDLRWQQRGTHFRLHFSGPFGAGAIEIEGTPGDVEIRSDDRRIHTSDAEAFLRRRYGWTLPVAGLRYWVLGLPAPESPAKLRYDNDGRLRRLQQNGWDIRYADDQGAAGYALPKHFQMKGGDSRFRIVIDRWSDVTPANH